MTLSPALSQDHPVIAVVDAAAADNASGDDVDGAARGAGPIVVWHVQTDPAFASFAAILSGAWVISEEIGDAAPRRLGDLLRGTVVVRSPRFAVVAGGHVRALGEAAGVVLGSGAEALAALAGAIQGARDEAAAAMKAEIAAKPALKAVRFPAVSPGDPDRLAAGYRGEELARDAWALARAVADLVEKWHEVENARRSRAYLKASFGEKVRPLPLPELAAPAALRSGD